MFYASRNIPLFATTVAEIPVLKNDSFAALRFQHWVSVY